MIGLGTWKSSEAGNAVRVAIEAGYRMIDCANDYGNEAQIGEVLTDLFKQGVIKRQDLFIQAKLWNTNHRFVREDLQATLDDLGVDYLDCYVIHWPQACPANGRIPGLCRPPHYNRPVDAEGMFPLAEDGRYCVDMESHYMIAWKVMEDLVAEGKVKAIGLSNFNIQQIREVLDNCKIRPVVLQNECHPYLQQKDLVDFCRINGITFQSYSPLASGDSPFRKPGDPTIFQEPVLLELANKHGKSVAQIVLRWHVQRGCSAVVKSVTPDRIRENIDILGFELSHEDMGKFDSLNRHWRFCMWPQTALHPDYPFKDELGSNYVVEKAPVSTSKSQ